MSLLLVAGDTKSTIQASLTDASGVALNLTGTTVRMYYRISGGDVQVRVMTLAADPTTGVATYQFQAGDLTVGDFIGEFEVTYGDGSILTSALSFSISVRMRTFGATRTSALSRLVVVDAGTFQAINGGVGALPFGTPVYISSPGIIAPAMGSSEVLSGVDGLVTDASVAPNALGTVLIDGILSGTQSQWAAVTDNVAGLVTGARYFLNPVVAGKLVQEGYAFLAGQWVVGMGRALAPTVFKIEIEEPIIM